MTGAVNFSMQTLYVPDLQAAAILAGYMLAVCTTAATLHALDITAKAW